MRSYIVNGIPVQADSAYEAARTLYPHARINGSLTNGGKAYATTWRTPEDEVFLVEEVEDGGS